jgi:aminoglycoside phosphotransferase (APT) family kinase protein
VSGGPPDRRLQRETVERMVAEIRPGWTVTDAALADDGHTSVYLLSVETDAGTRDVVLKATPDDEPRGVGMEARLLTVLAERTSIPVPTVYGAVGRHDDLRAPFFLMDGVEGADLSFTDTPTLSDAALERTARETGRHLGELHALDAVDRFGQVTLEGAAPGGDRPPTTPDDLTVWEPTDAWPARLGAWVDDHLAVLEGSRFDDLVPALDAHLAREVDALSGPFSPALGRIDHGVNNLRLDPETGAVRAVLDWGFTLAVPPTYDLSVVDYALSGRVLAALPDAPDRAALVREGLCAGYREAAGTLPGGYREHRQLYQLLSRVLSMTHVAADITAVPEEHYDAVAAALRREAEAAMAGQPL